MKTPYLARRSAYMCLLPIGLLLTTARRGLDWLSLRFDGHHYPTLAYWLSTLANRLDGWLAWIEGLGQ